MGILTILFECGQNIDLECVQSIGIIAGAILAVIGVIAAILRVLKFIWDHTPKPFVRSLVLWATVFFPNGVLVWYFIYQIAQIANRLIEPTIFLLIVAELTLLISVYTLIWGLWIHPKFFSQAQKQSNAKNERKTAQRHHSNEEDQ